MIIGHIGVALAAKCQWRRISLGVLLGATFAPDLLRAPFVAAGLPWQQTNFYTHALPWSLLLAVAAGALAWTALRDRTSGLVVFALVLRTSHWTSSREERHSGAAAPLDSILVLSSSSSCSSKRPCCSPDGFCCDVHGNRIGRHTGRCPWC